MWCSQCEHQRNPIEKNCFKEEKLQVVSSKKQALSCSPTEENKSKFGRGPLTLI